MLNENEIKAPEEGKEKLFSNEEVENIIKMRLKKANQEAENKKMALEQKLADAEEKLKSVAPAGVAIPNTNPAVAQPAAQPTVKQEVTQDVITRAIQQQQEISKYNEKLIEAKEKDPEFNKLTQTGNPVPEIAQLYMTHLDNAPAVLKHLLKDKKDHRMMDTLLAKGDEAAFVGFINSLSTQLDQSSSKPQPSPYEPAPEMSDAGDSGQDFDISNYVSGKY